MVLAPGLFLVWVTRSANRGNKLSATKRWRHCQHLDAQFCKEWCSDYLSCLQRRPKWLKKRQNLQAGYIVLVKDERLPFNLRALGLISETNCGQDGLVQSQGGAFTTYTRKLDKWWSWPSNNSKLYHLFQRLNSEIPKALQKHLMIFRCTYH